MRPVIAIALVLFLIGGVFVYANYLESIRPKPAQVMTEDASGQFDLEITCTFACESSGFGTPAVLVQFVDQVLLERSGRVEAGERLRVESIDQIKQGRNDVFISVNPADESFSEDATFSLDENQQSASKAGRQSENIARAVHIQIKRNEIVLASKTLWSDSAGPIADLVELIVR